MARSNKLYAPGTGADHVTALTGTPKYYSQSAAFWARSARYWKQAMWVDAQKERITGFNFDLNCYLRARANCQRDLSSARKARAKMIEPVLA